jgi:hypothetical protein
LTTFVKVTVLRRGKIHQACVTSINNVPKVKRFIDTADRIAREQAIDYQSPNTTIMHTDFVRERAERWFLHPSIRLHMTVVDNAL